MNKKKAIVLLSGGIDSTTTLVYALNQGFECYAISFDYNQKHKVELDYAKKIAKKYNVKEHKIIKISIDFIVNTPLVNKNLEVPQYNKISELPIGLSEVYVPARNILFLSYAIAWAESLKAPYIFIGANKDDYNGFPDCRPEFYEKFEEMVNLGTSFVDSKQKLKILTPFINSTKVEVIKYGIDNGINYDETFTCYNPINSKPCGKCSSCLVRKEALEKLID